MEQFDLYTCDRNKTGKIIERGTKVPEGLYRLVVHVCIFNSAGQMLIQQRQVAKTWGNLWDFSVGGHVQAGESSQCAGEREAMEELGLTLNLQQSAPALCVSFADGFDDIYVLKSDSELNQLVLQEEEVQAIRWAAMDEILAMIDDGSFIPYQKSAVELIFFFQNRRGLHTR